MFRVVICLSNSIRRSYISSCIEASIGGRERYVSIISFSSSKQLFRQGIKSLQPDIFIFDPLDEEGKMSNIASKIKQKTPHVTSFAIGALDFFSKPDLNRLDPIFPINLEDMNAFKTNLSNVIEQDLKDQNNFSYSFRSKSLSFPINDIQYFSSEGRKTHIISHDNSFEDIYFYKKLDCVENQLLYKKCQFVRIHKSFLVNTNYISSFNRRYITLTSGEILGISSFNNYKILSQIL